MGAVFLGGPGLSIFLHQMCLISPLCAVKLIGLTQNIKSSHIYCPFASWICIVINSLLQVIVFWINMTQDTALKIKNVFSGPFF